MREALSRIDLHEFKAPKDREGLEEFLGGIKDSKFGLGGKPIGLLDVLSQYKEKKDKDGFDFFESYYNSLEAEKNIKKSNEVLEIVYFNEEDEDEESLVNKIAFQTSETISRKVTEMFRERYEAAKSQEESQDQTPADKNKNNDAASE